jgi:hypothetical protein
MYIDKTIQFPFEIAEGITVYGRLNEDIAVMNNSISIVGV